MFTSISKRTHVTGNIDRLGEKISPKLIRLYILHRLALIKTKLGKSLNAAQERYNKEGDKLLRNLPMLELGELVYVNGPLIPNARKKRYDEMILLLLPETAVAFGIVLIA